MKKKLNMLLDEKRYASVVACGRDAVSKFSEKRMEEGFAIAEQGWKAFPETGSKWNQGYNYAMKNNDMVIAKCWLDRMIQNNDELHLYDFEIEHMKAKYEFEIGNLDEAFELWKNLIKQKGVGYRYFEFDDPKYKEFYKSRK